MTKYIMIQAIILIAAGCTLPPPPEQTIGSSIIEKNNRIAGNWITEADEGGANVTLQLAVSGGYIFSMRYMNVDFFIDQGISMVRPDSLTLNSLKKEIRYKAAYRAANDTLWLDLQAVFNNGYDDEIPVDFFMQNEAGTLLPFIRQERP